MQLLCNKYYKFYYKDFKPGNRYYKIYFRRILDTK